jgi:hypothetical protein
MMSRRELFPFAAFTLCACNAANFDPPSKIESVRILATAADKPYAKPGDTVNMTVLAFDGRANRPAPMGIWWLPQPCFNPPGDAYYGCYASFGRMFHPGVDVGSQLAPATAFSFEMPADVISTHRGERGGDAYGLAVTFAIACAGHVEYTPTAGGSADALPFGCFDENHAQLGPDDFVFAYSLVYAFNDRTNANPILERLTLNGSPVDPAAGISLDHCTQSNLDKCVTSSLDTVVPASSQEPDPSNVDANGNVLREEIWVDYYLTAWKVKHDIEILFDPRAGALSGTSDDLSAPQSSGSGLLWAVVHDNRGGVSWIEVPLLAR